MKKLLSKVAAVMAAVIAVSTILAGCGKGTGTSKGSTNFTILTGAAFTGTNWIEDYNDNPAAKYWLNMEWDAEGNGSGKKISVDFWHPTAGAEQDYVNNLIATGDYPDVMPLMFSSETILELYEEGIAMDITDYVEKYMPNYMAYLDAHPDLKNKVTNRIDGKNRYLQIFSVNDEQGDPWGGFLYRRDWIVKYGLNPETGDSFTGTWTDGVWTDDVVFPSGNTDPVYISDWEWMLEIFKNALDELGITDGYAMQLPSTGVEGTGDLMSGFGGVGPLWYYTDNTNVDYGTASDGMRACLECLKTWYDRDWVNKNFAENANDMFFMVDTASVYSGKVGVWYGLSSGLMDGIDSKSGDEADPQNGAVVYAAASPINDIYGDTSVQNKKPTVFYGDSLIGYGSIITDKAKDKDIATLLTAMDYLYSEEGARLYSFGLSDKQVAETKDKQYLEWGLENGAYTLQENAAGPATVVKDPMITNDQDSLSEAVSLRRLMGMNIANPEMGYSENMKYNLNIWKTYTNTGTIQNDLISQLPSKAASAYNAGVTDLSTVMAVWLPQFIDGKLNISDDADWKKYCDEVNSCNPEAVKSDLQNALTGK